MYYLRSMYLTVFVEMRPEGVVDTLVERVCDVYAENSFDAAVDCVEIGDKICSVVRDGGTVVRSGQEKMGRVAKRKRISVVSMQANVDAEGVKVVRDIMQRVGVRVPCGPLFGVARYVEALDRGRQGVRSGAVVILF